MPVRDRIREQIMMERTVVTTEQTAQLRPRASDLESAARAAIEMRAGRRLAEREWARARLRLLEFVTIIRGWEQKTKTRDSELDNVV
jgi:hypothetical protein